MSKGSTYRPMSVKYEDFSNSFDKIFGKKNMTPSYKDNGDDIGTCGCGRSPTGKCIGWHALTEEVYLEKLNAYLREVADEARKAEDNQE